MLIYAIDWATIKDLVVTNNGKDVKLIPATIEGFDKFLSGLNGDKYQLYFEEGGGDSFKLLANRNGYKVFTTLGKNTRDRREKLGIEKSDKNDVKIIFDMAKSNPELFREFALLDIITAKICVLFKIRSDAEENLVRAKNRLFSLNKRLELLDLGKDKLKLFEKEKDTISKLEAQFKLQTSTLGKLVNKHPIWKNYLKNEKGIGAVVAGGLIAGIKRASKFDDRFSLRHYAGMIEKKGNQKFNHHLKRALYFFTEGIIKARTPVWRELYDNMKVYYANKHPDWKKGKINNYAKKFVQTKFLDGLYKRMVEVENATMKM
jgi:hypothetical protein